LQSNHIDGRNLRSQETRKKILEAAEDVFLVNGFKKTTIKMINEKANTAHGTAYAHFKDGKDQIFTYIFKEILKNFYEVAEITYAPQSVEEAYEIIKGQICDLLALAEKHREILKVCSEAIGVSPYVRQEWNLFIRQLTNRAKKDIQYAQSKGIAKMIEGEIVANIILFISEKYLWQIVLAETEYSIKEISETITKVYMFGLYNKPLN